MDGRVWSILVLVLSAAAFAPAQGSATRPAAPELRPLEEPEPIRELPGAAPPTRAAPAPPGPDAPRVTLVEAFILGVVEGVTEYLPVSSTGHLILVGHWLGLGEDESPRARAVDAFDIVIQLGAVLAVLGLYRRRCGQMAAGLVGKSPRGLRMVGLLAVAFLPAAVVGLLFREQIKAYLFGPLPVAVALAVGGGAMILADRLRGRHGRGRSTLANMTFTQALLIGLAQCLAMWPGTSRSMVTIVAGLVVGLDMVAAAEFSFLLALPTLGGATLYEATKSRDALVQYVGPLPLLVGLAVSCVVAAISVKALVRWLTAHGLTPFGIYRILLAIVVLAVLVFGVGG